MVDVTAYRHRVTLEALHLSIGWLSQASRLDQPAARFLFCILAIEALATYIEEEAPDESPLARLRAERLTKAERQGRRERCIDETLGEWLAAQQNSGDNCYRLSENVSCVIR